MKSKFQFQNGNHVFQVGRGLTETYADLLQTAETYHGISYCRILDYCQLGGLRRKPLVDRLVERGLISIEKRSNGRGRIIIVTEKGREWLLKALEVLATIS